jgi:C_GCAxxG_C_C family probable redox protein
MTGDKEREVKLQELSQKARDLLPQCGNCAQTSFYVLQEEFGLDGQEILKALTPFPGLALRGETCGAVTGSLMAIGLVFGRDKLDDWKGYTNSLRPARHFCKCFEDLHGSTACADILEAALGRSFNLADRNESAEYLAAGGTQKCCDLVADAVRVAAEVIMDQT